MHQDASSSSGPHAGAGPLTQFLQTLYSTRVLPNERPSLHIARPLIPIMRKLKWCMQRDNLAKLMKAEGVHQRGIVEWLESERGRRVVHEGEKVRLAVCPNIRKKVGFYEELCRT